MKNLFSIFISILIAANAHATAVTLLSGVNKNGQVFLTWQNVSNQNAFYKVYRSTSQIASSADLVNCEYLGYTNSSSSKDFNLTHQDGVDRFLHIDSAGLSLSSTTGLFVATTLENGSYYYAVTTLVGAVEDQSIIAGNNSLIAPISETVSTPMPVYQETRVINDVNVDVYTNFISLKYEVDSPLMNKAGFLAFDFGLFRNFPDGSKQPMRFRFHAGGEAFLDNVTSVTSYAHEINISCEEKLPSGQRTGYWGTNVNYDVYDSLKNTKEQTEGVNYNYVQLVIQRTMLWAKKFLPVDTNRIYLEGSSLGAIGSYFFALNYPDDFAAIKLTAGVFDFGFDNDYQINCSLNAGRKNRKDGDRRMGTIAKNLPSSLGIKTYDLFDGGSMINKNITKDFPFVYSLNGKKDKITGWTEKTIYYDSVNSNKIGGYFFWDEGDHGGNGGVWNSEVFDLFRYNKLIAYPAFSNCSINGDWGLGNDSTGDAYGTLNGMLDWKNEIVDSEFMWQSKIFIRDLVLLDSSIVSYPDSATVTITPRRIQHFFPPAGTNINWTVEHNQQIVQSGIIISNGSLITISGIKIFKDTSIFTLSYGSLFYKDEDGDGFGNPLLSVTATTQPAGYVSDNTDCNDQNSSVNPSVADVCNGIDDNCDGIIDENNAIIATISPAGTVNACKSLKVKLSSSTGAGYLYQWKKDGVNISGATKANYTSTGNESGSFTVLIATADGCSKTSDATVINRLPKPDAVITPLGNLDICSTGAVLLSASSGDGNKYKWFLNGAKITGATNQTFNAIVTGSFTVKVTDANGCSKTSAAVIVTSSCKQNENINLNENAISVYPNPNNGNFNLKIDQSFLGNEIKVQIKNIVGQSVYASDFILGNEDLKVSLPENILSGIYLLEVTAGEKFFSKLLTITGK